MANFFIGVGGTGQQVAIAYCKLTKLCGYEPAKIYIMDSDLSIARLQSSFIPLEPIPIQPCILPLQRNSFRSLFNSRQDQAIDSVLSVLFTPKELGTPIDDGMFGKPPVGSATIMDKIVLMDNDTTPQQICRFSDTNLSNLLTTLETPGNHCIVICGSAKGGTGAGGVPTLAQYISSKVDRRRVKIVILYFLRHFNILLPTEQDENEIKNRQLSLNAESGMCYLANEISKHVDACVLFGLLEPVDIPYRKTQKQEEMGMFLYLLSAIVGNNSYNANIEKLFPQNSDKIYTYWIPYDVNSNISNLMLSDIDVYLPNGGSVGLDNIPKLAKATVDFLEIFSKYINPLPRYSFIPSLIVPRRLKEAIDTLMKNIRKNKKETCQNIALNIQGYKKEIEGNIGWFRSLLEYEKYLANQKPRAGVLSKDNDEAITITEEGYEKSKRQPMGFIRDLAKEINWGEPEETMDFVKPLVIGLRSSINKTFLGNIFHNMEFTG